MKIASKIENKAKNTFFKNYQNGQQTRVQLKKIKKESSGFVI